MRSNLEVKKLGDVIFENKKSNIRVRDASKKGKYTFFTSGEKRKKLNSYLVDGENIFISTGGKAVVSYYDGKASYSTDAYVINGRKDIAITKYIYYFVLLNINLIDDRMFVGAAIKHLQKKDFKNLHIPIPSISEQKRIVAILDKAFIAIDRAKVNVEQSLKNSSELFESYLQSIFLTKGEDWEKKKLEEICIFIGGGTPSKKNSKFYNGDIYWATVRDMKGEIIKDTQHKITKDAVKKSSTHIIPKGNVIIATRVGLGRVCLIENDTAINQDLRAVIPVNTKQLSVDFLYRWFKSIAHEIIKEGTGATVQGVKLPFIKSLAIFLPSLSKQQVIIHDLDLLSVKTKKLGAIYQKKINDMSDFKKSILKKAFIGEL